MNQPEHHDQSAVEQLAYQLWEARGCPIGSPDEDWYQAQEKIRNGQVVFELPVFSLSMGPSGY